MSIEWGGPFASTTLPLGQRITGWSEGTTGAGTLKTRYRDGDPCAAFLWREMYGNINYHIATSRRIFWVESFNDIASAEPLKDYTGTDITALGAIYAVTPAKIVTRNPRRGDNRPPQLVCRVRARKDADTSGQNAVVRIYSVGSLLEAVTGWTQTATNAPATSYVSWNFTATAYAWSATSNITIPQVSERTYPYPVQGAFADVDVWVTYLVLACSTGSDGDKPLVAQVEVFEEAPGA